ncbi:hypothetical protein P43SY_004428 [Pythium insidiosum]|uniref:Sulfatase N-terminal domain-containing protein n=1 Tax=Pythium insidiosum TaxID=114742 RepID=A0AAD5LRU5_PYTIN|nr:hypothetical protein P43SY_004428 [Pythium insidiosum]
MARTRLNAWRDGCLALFGMNRRPARQWLLLYLLLGIYFLVSRFVSLSALVRTFAAPHEDRLDIKLAALCLAVVQDALVTTLLLILLSIVDFIVGPRHERVDQDSAKRLPSAATIARILRIGVRFILHFGLVALALVPFATDQLMLRVRGMRFTFGFVTMTVRELKFAAGVSIAARDERLSRETVGGTVAFALIVAVINVWWLDFSRWGLHRLFMHKPTTAANKQDEVEMSDMRERIDEREDDGTFYELEEPSCFVLFTAIVLGISRSAPVVVAAVALNDSLNELFRLTLHLEFQPSLGDGSIESASLYIHNTTEEYSLFRDDVLFRRTMGFKGPKAFNVTVDPSTPPNVVVLVVESFRYSDSLYIAGDNQALPTVQHNVSLTPNFDRWAKRGVAFRNFWSSWQTSRSVESILFGQVPFDDVFDTGTSTGRKKVHLEGMPQLFKAKGYETTFSTGCRIRYDQWDKFMPSHGFEHVLGVDEIKRLAEQRENLTRNDWKLTSQGGKGRGFFWGVHDDVALDVLGDMLIDKTVEQQRQANDSRRPFFVNHYTISSHQPFYQEPEWYQKSSIPDFSALYKQYSDRDDAHWDVLRYTRMRYFTDLAIGRFLDRMKNAGVLNDTIVVIVGDHGHSPESGLVKPYIDQIGTTRVAAALIAEGRLGDAAGLVLDDAAEHYDLLNTVADIVGVPPGGFLQTGVGRSLLRAVPFGERPVWSNNPMLKLAVVRGHRRLQYDRRYDMMQLHDAESDPKETTDLYETLTDGEKVEMRRLRSLGRRLNRYFRVRWDRRCLTKVKC